MKIKNISNKTLLLSKVRNGKDLILSPNKEVVLYDEDVEKNKTLMSYIKKGLLQIVSKVEPFEEELGMDVDNSMRIDALQMAIEDLISRVEALENRS